MGSQPEHAREQLQLYTSLGGGADPVGTSSAPRWFIGFWGRRSISMAAARCCPQHRRHVTGVRKFSGDGAWYEPPPPRTRRTIGRPCVNGEQRPSPPEGVVHTTHRTQFTVAWDGRTTSAIELITGTGHWYRLGEALVAVRWVYGHDAAGTHCDESCVTTALPLRPKQLVEC